MRAKRKFLMTIILFLVVLVQLMSNTSFAVSEEKSDCLIPETFDYKNSLGEDWKITSKDCKNIEAEEGTSNTFYFYCKNVKANITDINYQFKKTTGGGHYFTKVGGTNNYKTKFSELGVYTIKVRCEKEDWIEFKFNITVYFKLPNRIEIKLNELSNTTDKINEKVGEVLKTANKTSDRLDELSNTTDKINEIQECRNKLKFVNYVLIFILGLCGLDLIFLKRVIKKLFLKNWKNKVGIILLGLLIIFALWYFNFSENPFFCKWIGII